MDASRTAALLAALAAVVGCATPDKPPGPAPLIGRILSTTEITVMAHRVKAKHFTAEVWRSYRIAPEGSPDVTVTAVGGENDCPKTGDADPAYVFTLERRRMLFGLTGEGDKALISDLVITSCVSRPAAGGA